MRALEHDDLEVRGLIDELGSSRASLVPILLELKQRGSTLDRQALALVAEGLRLRPAEVAGVASFYSFLGSRPRGRFAVRLCRSISCDLCDKDRTARELEANLGIRFGETTPDGTFTLEWTNCLGMCDQGPALLVNDELHARVTSEHARELLDQCRTRAALEAEQVVR